MLVGIQLGEQQGEAVGVVAGRPATLSAATASVLERSHKGRLATAVFAVRATGNLASALTYTELMKRKEKIQSCDDFPDLNKNIEDGIISYQ